MSTIPAILLAVLTFFVLGVCIWMVVDAFQTQSPESSPETILSNNSFQAGSTVSWGLWSEYSKKDEPMTWRQFLNLPITASLPPPLTEETLLLWLPHRSTFTVDGSFTKMVSFVVGYPESADSSVVIPIGYVVEKGGHFWFSRDPEQQTVFRMRTQVNDAFHLTSYNVETGQYYGWRFTNERWFADENGTSDSWIWHPYAHSNVEESSLPLQLEQANVVKPSYLNPSPLPFTLRVYRGSSRIPDRVWEDFYTVADVYDGLQVQVGLRDAGLKLRVTNPTSIFRCMPSLRWELDIQDTQFVVSHRTTPHTVVWSANTTHEKNI